MKKKVLMILSIFFLIFSFIAPLPAAAFDDSFDTGSAGWETLYVRGSTDSGDASSWSDAGGNPGGHIYSYFNGTDNLYAFDSPEFRAGDLTDLTLKLDFKISGTADSATAKARWYIGSQKTDGNNYFVSKDSYSWNPSADTDWTTHTIAVNESNFYRRPNGGSGTKTFAEVAAEGQWVGLFFLDRSSDGISSTDGATVYLDNISAVPTPEAILLIASAFLGLIGINRKIGT